jgi:hypothetical protein
LLQRLADLAAGIVPPEEPEPAGAGLELEEELAEGDWSDFIKVAAGGREGGRGGGWVGG